MPHRTTQPWRIAHSESSLGWGGQEHRVLAELSGFQRRGAAVWLLAPLESEVFKRAIANGIPVRPFKPAKLAFPWRALEIAIWLRRQQIQIVNPHSSRDGWLVGLASRLAGIPLIIRTRHIDVTYPNRWLSRHAFTTLCDHVLTTSEKIRTHFREYFSLPPDRVTTIPTGIDLSLFSPEGPRARLFPESPNGSPIIGMVSVLRSWKGHETFLRAVRLLLDADFKGRFAIVGEGPIREAIQAQIREQKLESSVKLLGHREDVPAVLRDLSLLIIPSTRHEGVPQIGLQALASETPVIGSDIGGIPEIIIPNQTGRIFPSENAEALAAAIRAAFEQPAATTAMAKNGRALVERKHSLDSMLDSLETIYRRYLPL